MDAEMVPPTTATRIKVPLSLQPLVAPLLPQLTPGSPVVPLREPENPADELAVRLETAEGDHVGYVERRLAARLAPWMDAGWIYTGVVQDHALWRRGRRPGWASPTVLLSPLLRMSQCVAARSRAEDLLRRLRRDRAGRGDDA